jgi:hypothetical protein
MAISAAVMCGHKYNLFGAREGVVVAMIDLGNIPHVPWFASDAD